MTNLLSRRTVSGWIVKGSILLFYLIPAAAYFYIMAFLLMPQNFVSWVSAILIGVALTGVLLSWTATVALLRYNNKEG